MLRFEEVNEHVSVIGVGGMEGEVNRMRKDEVERVYHQIKEWSKGLVKVVVVVQERDMNGPLFDLDLLYNRMNNNNLEVECIDYLQKLQSLARVIHKMKMTVVQIYDGQVDSSYSLFGSNSEFRITTERASYTVDLNKRGLTCLGGESYVLGRLERNIGSYLLMTNECLSHTSMLAVNLCNYLLDSTKIKWFISQLAERIRLAKTYSTFLIDQLLQELHPQQDWGQTHTSPIHIQLENKIDYQSQDDQDLLAQINWLFSKKKFEKIVEAIESNIRTNKLSQKVMQGLQGGSYEALQLNFHLVNKVQQAENFDTGLQMEYQLMLRSLQNESVFQALKAYMKGERMDWELYREQVEQMNDINENIMSKESEGKYFQIDDMTLDKSILEKRNQKGQVELRRETQMTLSEMGEQELLGQLVETQEEEEWESSQENTKQSIPHISIQQQNQDYDKIYQGHISNINRSKEDYDLYLTDIKTVLRATLSRQMYILQNRFKYLIEQLRKTKVSLATFNSKKNQLDKQIDDDQILVDLQNESAKLSIYSQKLNHKYESLFEEWDVLVSNIQKEKVNIKKRKIVLDQINKENIKLITQKKALEEVLLRLKGQREPSQLAPIVIQQNTLQAQNSISGIQYQSEDQIQVNLKQSISQTMLHYADLSAEEVNEYHTLQKTLKHYQSLNIRLKNQFIQLCRTRLEQQQEFKESWSMAVHDLQRFQKISASDGLQSSLLFTLKETQKKQGTSQGQKFFSNLIKKQPSTNPEQMTRNIIHGTLKNLLNKKKQKHDKSQFLQQNFELIRNNFQDYKSNQILAILQINRKAINTIDKIYYDKEKQLQTHVNNLQKLLQIKL